MNPNLNFTTIFPNFWLLLELQPNRSPDLSSNSQFFEIWEKSQNLARLRPCDIKFLSFRPGVFGTTSYSEIFEYFAIICIFQIWLTLYPNLTFTPIFPYFLFLPLLQPNPFPDPSSNTQNFQTRVKSQNLPRWLSCDIKSLYLHREGF